MTVSQFAVVIPAVDNGIAAIFAAVIIGAWTAFEVLAGDLWVELVNNFPVLGVRALNADPESKDSDETRRRKAQKTFEVVVQRVLDPDFDVKRKMGDILSPDFPMTSFERIIKAYEKIFRDKAVSNIIRDRGVRSLSAVRHVLVHRAGTVDAPFVQQVSGDPRFAQAKTAEKLTLDGAIAAALAESAVTQGIKLIKFADQWCSKSLRKP